jgi:hypothetical protein
VPPPPTATNCVPLQVTDNKPNGVPAVLEVHVIPSGEVRITPALPPPPTATNCVLLQITSSKISEVPLILEVQVIPSDEVRIVPLAPTATNSVPLQDTPLKACVVPLLLAVQLIPGGIPVVKATPALHELVTVPNPGLVPLYRTRVKYGVVPDNPLGVQLVNADALPDVLSTIVVNPLSVATCQSLDKCVAIPLVTVKALPVIGPVTENPV